MPEVFRYKGYRFFFFSREDQEPVHIHVENAEKYAKYWLEPQVGLAESYGFLNKELKEIRLLIIDNEAIIRQKWHEHITRHRETQN